MKYDNMIKIIIGNDDQELAQYISAQSTKIAEIIVVLGLSGERTGPIVLIHFLFWIIV